MEEAWAAADERAIELVDCYKAGEQRAMEELYELYFQPVYDYMYRALRNEDDAHEAAQLVFVKALHGIDRYEPRKGTPFRAWLFHIARNVALDLKQLERRRRELLEPPETIDSLREGQAVGQELSIGLLDDADLEFFVKRLPESQREVVLLRHFFDLPMKRIAETVGRTPEAVSELHRRAMADLEQRLSAVRARRERIRRRVPMRMRFKPARVIVSRRFSLGSPRSAPFKRR